MTQSVGRESDKFMLRFPEGMRDEIKRLAAENGRSMNAEIVELLNFALEHSGVDIDEILSMLAAQRAEMAQLRNGRDFSEVETENQRLRSRLELWEPLILQATPEELERLRQRLVRFRAVLEGDDANEILKGIMLPVENLAEQFPSLADLQRLFDKIRAADNPEKSDRAAPHWDWENAQADAPPPIPKPKSGQAKRQKR